MMKINKSGALSLLFAAIAAGPIAAQVPPSEFVNFEGAQTNPIRISADGTRLFALNTPNGTLSVFSLATPSSPALIAEIPVGIEPVSVNINPNVAGDNEAWVVNQISNSVSVVSVSQGIVTDTIYAKAEPSDVVFAGNGLAFVSVARSNLVNVYSASTHALVKSIPLTGEEPRALAVSPDGSTVYVAFALSGNQTTIVPATRAPAPPPPVNPALPPAPQVGLIINATDPTWYPGVIKYTMPDNDVAAISTTSLSVSNYFSHLGTINLGLAVNPKSGNLYVANTDALNTIMFETALNGHIVNHQITSVNPTTGQSTIWDLNPQINYSQPSDPNGIATALAMPTAIVSGPTGAYLYIAAFGTDRVGIFNTSSGTVTKFIEIDPQALGGAVNPASKRGPRGLALNSTANVLYVLNRISNTISIINLSNDTVTSEIATGSFDPTPVAIRNGRGFLYDHKLSGNGTGACASCHIDSEMDLLAWNLGNPDGDMTYLYKNSTCCSFHPMKGPMTTQSLRGLGNMEPYHWRGDKPDFAAFNGAFAALLGGSQLSDADMTAFTNFINTIVYQPNPNLNLDGTYPATIQLADYPAVSASPLTGQGYFLDIVFNPTTEPGVTCSFCHASDPVGSNGVVTGTGTNLNVRIPTGGGPGAEQPFKIPHLRNLYQKLNQNFTAGAVSVNGFGFNHDGAIGGLFAQAGQSTFGSIATSTPEKQAIDAFEMCFPTGTVPATGYSRTLTSTSVNTSPAQTDWSTLQSQAMAGAIDLIANGTIQGQVHGLLFQPATNNYATDTTGLGPFTQAQLTAFIVAGDTLTMMGVPPGSGNRMALDMNSDGHKNGDLHRRLATKLISAAH
jgi:DNA-binding beta-propeller fold protein YncE